MTVAGEPVVVLLAEDDPAHAEIVRRNLTRFPVANRLLHVKDGQEALEYLRGAGKSGGQKQVRPHLILLDLRMPRVDGLQVLKEVEVGPRAEDDPGSGSDHFQRRQRPAEGVQNGRQQLSGEAREF